MDLLSFTREGLKSGELQRRVTPQCSILTGVEHGEPHQLIAQRWCVLEQHNVLADGCPAPGIDLAGHVIGRNLKSSKLVAMTSPPLSNCEAVPLVMVIYPGKHETSLKAMTLSA